MTLRPPQFRFSDKAYGELREAARALISWDAPMPKQAAEESRRLELIATLDRQLAEIERQLSASRSSGAEAGNPHIAALEQQAGQLSALRQRVQSAGSLASLAQLRTQVTDTVSAASNTLKTVEAGIATSGSATLAALRQEHQRISADNQAWLERTAGAFDARTEASASLAAKYGIDISEEKKALDEDRKREQEEKDPLKKLDWRISGLKRQISIHDKNLANPNLTKAERRREEEERKKAAEELKQAEDRQARERVAQQKEDHAKASEQGQTTPQDDLAAAAYARERQHRERSKFEPLLKDTASIQNVAGYVGRQTTWRGDNSEKASEPVRAVIAQARALDAQGQNSGTKQRDSETSLDNLLVQTAVGETKPIETAQSMIALATTPEAHEKVETPNTPKTTSPSIASAKA